MSAELAETIVHLTRALENARADAEYQRDRAENFWETLKKRIMMQEIERATIDRLSAIETAAKDYILAHNEALAANESWSKRDSRRTDATWLELCDQVNKTNVKLADMFDALSEASGGRKLFSGGGDHGKDDRGMAEDLSRHGQGKRLARRTGELQREDRADSQRSQRDA